jgi:hypothetical protein
VRGSRSDRTRHLGGKIDQGRQNREPGIFLGGPRRRIRFFGVVTRYHLKLQTLPKAMHGCSYFYPIEEAATVAAWLERIAGSLATSVELSSHSSQEEPD